MKVIKEVTLNININNKPLQIDLTIRISLKKKEEKKR